MAEDAARLRLLYELGCAFAARIELDELSALVVQKSREVLDAEGAAILLFDQDRDELYFPYVADADPEVAARLLSLRFPADRGIAGAVLRSARPLRIDNVSTDPRFHGGVDHHTGVTTRALICAPLTTPQGTIGVIQVLNPRGGGCFNDDHLAFLGHNRPYLLRQDGSVEVLEGTGGAVLGVLEDRPYAAKHAALRSGDGVFLYTDGVTEAMDAGGNLFSDGRLHGALGRHSAAAPEALIHAVVDEVSQHAGEVAQSDDITALAIRYRG